MVASNPAPQVGGRHRAERLIEDLIADLVADPKDRRNRLAARYVLPSGGFDPADFPEIGTDEI